MKQVEESTDDEVESQQGNLASSSVVFNSTDNDIVIPRSGAAVAKAKKSAISKNTVKSAKLKNTSMTMTLLCHLVAFQRPWPRSVPVG